MKDDSFILKTQSVERDGFSETHLRESACPPRPALPLSLVEDTSPNWLSARHVCNVHPLFTFNERWKHLGKAPFRIKTNVNKRNCIQRVKCINLYAGRPIWFLWAVFQVFDLSGNSCACDSLTRFIAQGLRLGITSPSPETDLMVDWTSTRLKSSISRHPLLPFLRLLTASCRHLSIDPLLPSITAR